MEYIPSSPAEVKRIIEAVNLRTNDIDLYEMGARGICERPFSRNPAGFKCVWDEVAPEDFLSIVLSDGREFIGCGPDLSTILSGPPDLQPPYPIYKGDTFLYFERPERFTKPKPDELARIGVMPVSKGSPKENLREASLRSERPHKSKTDRPATGPETVVPVRAPQEDAAPADPERERPEEKINETNEVNEDELAYWKSRLGHPEDQDWERKLKTKMPDPARDNVIDLPAVEKLKVIYTTPPKDVLAVIQKGYRGKGIERTVYKVYARSCYQPINRCWGYAGKSTKKGRYYNQGMLELADKETPSGRSERRHLKWLVDNDIFLFRKRGYMKEGCSIYELPCNLDNVEQWKRYVKSSRGKRSSRRK